ncbi:putative transcriptional regulatory protein [Lachnellula subtilissima]|uniref:Putative transcriptional regulatory protein n=1 Tax=Lachnellula subtilissima TaxID=602034 RepID=A0A8H8RLN7_9HELO|nr:putative transcriptional regulatory protein [Lachnellula subtilissima]
MSAIIPQLVNRQNADLLSSPSNSLRRSTTPSGQGFATNEANGSFNPQASNHSLPPAHVLSSLVDTYFTHVQNQPYCFFHPRRFRQRLSDGLLPDYLLFAVLASALRFSNNSYYNGAYAEATTMYARESWKQIVMSWLATESDPDIGLCQAITLLSIIDFTAGRRHQSWLKIGLSIRIAQDLCLMNEPNPSLSYEDQEERRRVFWSIYILDKLCSCGRARPAAIADAHCRVQLPCDDAAFRDSVYKTTSTLDRTLCAGDSSTYYPEGGLALVVLVACILGRSAQHSIHESSNGETWLPPWDSKSEFATIYSVLLQLETRFELGGSINEAIQRNSLPGGGPNMQIVGSLIFAKAIFHTSQCILHHPFLLSLQLKNNGLKAPASFLSRALQTCREHACSMSELLSESSRAGCTAFYSFIGYCATVASGIHTMFLNNTDVYIHQKAVECIKSDKVFLGQFSRFWANGRIMSLILQNLTAQSISSTSLVTSPPNAASLDQNTTGNLWAAVDYTTMCTKKPAPELELDLLFGESAVNGSSNSNHYFSPPVAILDEQSPYGDLMFDSTSPITAFLRGSSMNFGG